jgi:ribosomal protein S18 acetylase RimI-like enzyme
MKTIIRLTKKHVKPAAEVLARAFHNYPVAEYVFPNESKRLKVQTYVFQSSICYGIHYGVALATSPELEGIAVWLPPNNVYESTIKMIRCVNINLLFSVSLKTISRGLPFFFYLDGYHKQFAPFPHWYLEVIGVDPKYQGKGYGNFLIKAMTKKIDKESLPIYLETNTKKNVGFYQNHGFKVVKSVLLPSTGVSTWCMLRNPQQKNGA